MFDRKDIEDVYPLSPLQEGIYFHSKLNTSSLAYFEQFSMRVVMRLDVQILEQSFNEIIRRHPVLRTVFTDRKAGQPLQVVLKQRRIRLDVADLTGLAAEAQEQQVETYRNRDRNTPFDLSKDMLLRVGVLKLSNELFEIILSHHHIILDGGSFRIIAAELKGIYRLMVQGQPINLPAPRPFSDYIKWTLQRDVAAAKRFWKDYLLDYDQKAVVPRLPINEQQRQYQLEQRSYEGIDKKRLMALLEQLAITPFTFFKAIWGIMLGKYNDAADVIFGTIVSGRPTEIHGVNDIMGLFINAVPVRVKATADKRFDELATSFQMAENQTKRYEHYPLPEIQEESILRRDLIDHLLIVNNYTETVSDDDASQEDAFFDVLDWKGAYQTPYDFVITVSIGANIRVDFEFNNSQIDDRFAEGMVQHFSMVVEQVLKEPAIRIGDISLLSETEKKQQLSAFQEIDGWGSCPVTIPEMLDQCVAARADKAAVVYNDHVISYACLQQHVNRVAHYLQLTYEVKRGDIVAILLPVSERLPMVILAVLKAGAAYLPLNTDDPGERILQMLADAAPQIVITAAALEEKVLSSGVKRIDQDKLFRESAVYETSPPAYVNKGTDPAITFFTSGSTGRPKGVLVQHTNVVSFSKSYDQLFGLSGDFRILSYASISWDMSTPEILSGLLLGATVVLVSRSDLQNDLFILRLIKRAHIDFIQLTPSSLQFFLETDADIISHFRYLLVGGEALPLQLFQRLRRVVGTRVVNVYGPTETATWSTYYEMNGREHLTVGKPMPGEEIYVLSADMGLLPAGVPGEIYIGGEGVAAGYLNNPELTNAVFVSHPFKPGKKLYKTGDMGRLLADGNLEFLGRKDNQIKIRGYRVEMNEIEQKALEVDGVGKVLLHSYETANKERALALYYIREDIPVGTDPALPAQISREELEKQLTAIVAGKNDVTAHQASAGKLLMAHFEGNAQKFPDAVAIAFGDIFITYGELNRRVDKLSRYLIREAFVAGRETIIGVLMDRSARMVEVILAIWKSGAAYLPLNPEYPAVSIRQIIDDALPAVVIYEDETLRDKLPAEAATLRLPMEVNDGLPTVAEKMSPARDEDLAYIMYTSGSTGAPKGVMIEHLGMINHIQGKIDDFEVNRRSIIVQNASVSFDISVWQLVTALVAGACTRIYTNAVVRNPEQFIRETDAHCVTILELVPTYLVEMMEILKDDNRQRLFAGLEFMILNAETFRPSLLEQWLKRFPGKKIANTYGATETSDDISHYIMDGKPAAVTVPVLRTPIHGAEVYVLDESGRPTETGEKGEIVIGGVCVGRGYINDPEQTFQKYITVSHQGLTCRFYRTGDIGLINNQGELEFAGRNDKQVKVRGHRVEIEEVEIKISHIAAVKDCTVLYAEDSHEEPYLHLFYTLKDGYSKEPRYIKDEMSLRLAPHMIPSVTVCLDALPVTDNGKIDRAALKKLIRLRGQSGKMDARIRTYLAAALPSYMVPSYIRELEKFPLTPNGKNDLKALPIPHNETTEEGKDHRFISETERQMALIWEEVLNGRKVGPEDNFFEIGGHSLKSTRVISRVSGTFDITTDIAALFKYPVLRDFSAYISTLKKALHETIVPLEECDHYPAGHSQRRFWTLEQIEDNGNAYLMPSAYTICGSPDVLVLERVFRVMVESYEILRTTFVAADGPRQKVVPADEMPRQFHYLDLSAKEDPLAHVKLLIEQERQQRIDFTKGPLFRVRLFRYDKNRFVLLFLVHHLVSDGWSTEIMRHQLNYLYNELKKDAHFKLPPRTLQYKDCVAWQYQQLNGPAVTEHRRYWQDRLSGELPVLDLPLSKSRPVEKTFVGAVLEQGIPPQLTEKIKRIAATEGASVFMVLLSVCRTLFYRYTAQEDMILGTSIAGRAHGQLEDQIGLFMNTVPLRTRVNSKENFYTVLSAEKRTLLEAYQHQDYPFDLMIQDLKVKRRMDRSPIFDVLVEFQDFEETLAGISADTAPEDFSIDGFSLDNYAIKFDLNIVFIQHDGQLKISFGYNTGLFDKAHACSIVDQYLQLAEQLLNNPFCPVGEADIVLPEEKRILRSAFKQTDLTNTVSLNERLYEHSLRWPGHICAGTHHEQLSYLALDSGVQLLARSLKDNYRIQPKDVVAVLLPRSLHLMESILAIWQCGAVYLPVDPSYPEHRIGTILEDAAPALIITNIDLLHEHLFMTALSIPICMFTPPTARCSRELPKQRLPFPSLEDDAYIIYTSGSTGKPKGAVISHLGMLNHIQAKVHDLGLDESAVVIQNASQGFDVSIWQLFAALFTGGKTVILEKDEVTNPAALIRGVAVSGAGVLQVVPSYLSLLFAAMDQQQELHVGLRGLKTLVTVGELLTASHIRKWFGYFPGTPILNSYGPTEASDAITHAWLTSAAVEDPVPVGYAVQNAEVYVLDDNLQLCPPWVYGQVCVSGAGVGKGYLNMAEKTAEVFVEKGFLGKTIYKTGDWGRFLPSGDLELKGRIDHQVKINGNRIEPEEIVHHIVNSRLVTDAKVLLVDRGADKVLVAFIVTPHAEDIRTQLRSVLTKCLPPYMIPAYFQAIETFPLTASGKVDLLKLKAAFNASMPDDTEEQRSVPEMMEERLLLTSVASVLEMKQARMQSNFFELGGDSIKAIRLVMELKSQGWILDVKDVFRTGNLKELAACMQKATVPVKRPPDIPSGAPTFDYNGLSPQGLDSIFE
ncbi:amino acid adenylation domain-containing protein [Chitinophaga oryzae]|uniref:Amino acid adenylation domain-containing protein n=1 Tax=Chitinophaga oryzae TaxID=2725414 RepID=A0ABX6LGQ6_9BACT|nr:non-ribosomal peptide synthetase [Chitinophaga oryzae]QJB39309.1 amino acid adenylation domain-containing protein [Chitinophaga oryzae]